MEPTSVYFWLVWAVILLAQNFAFTYVSRARNSGSLGRHVKAAIMSNGVWFISQTFAVSTFMKILSGALGIKFAIFAGLFYTTFTIAGSIYAHYRSLKSEKGKSAVGANSKYAQIPVEDWEAVKRLVLNKGAIVGGLETYGTTSGRIDSSKPNLANVPQSASFYPKADAGVALEQAAWNK